MVSDWSGIRPAAADRFDAFACRSLCEVSMLPLPGSRLRSSVVLSLVAALLATPAAASWSASGEVLINVDDGGGVVVVDAEDVEPGANVTAVRVGGSLPHETGELTVVGEGSVTERQPLGSWTVAVGVGNVQSTYGTGFFVVGNHLGAGTVGELELLNSDVTASVRVRNGTLRVRAGSKLDSIDLFSEGNAYVVEGSRVSSLTTDEGSYLSVAASTVQTLSHHTCRLQGTVLIVDSHVGCGSLELSNGADMDVMPALSSFSELSIDNDLLLIGGSVDVSASDAGSGSIELGGHTQHATSLRVSGGTAWTNTGDIAFILEQNGPIELVVSGGAQFDQQGTVNVSNETGDGLVVTGGGTALAVAEDLVIGHPTVATVPGTMTVAGGADVVVQGTLVVGAGGVLDLQPGGTLYANATQIDGTILENGGVLVVPEPLASLSGVGALLVLGRLARRSRRRRIRR
jgi:hypothetical protein